MGIWLANITPVRSKPLPISRRDRFLPWLAFWPRKGTYRPFGAGQGLHMNKLRGDIIKPIPVVPSLGGNRRKIYKPYSAVVVRRIRKKARH